LKSVWMQIDGDRDKNITLTQSTEPRLWFVNCNVSRGSLYCYGAEVDKRWYNIKTHSRLLEDDHRRVMESSTHRDIFAAKKFPTDINAYMYFFQDAIVRLETTVDLQKVLDHYFLLDHSRLQPDEQYKLGRFATKCASTVASKPCAAAFIVYYLSKIYRMIDSMQHSRIESRDAADILRSLQDWPLQESLGVHFTSRITQVMWNLVTVEKSCAGWDSLVFWCFPSLSSAEILKKKISTEYHASPELVDRLFSCVGKHEGAEHLLCTILPLSELCAVFKVLHPSDDERMKELLDKCWPYFTNVVKEQLGKLRLTRHFKELNDLAENTFSGDCTVMSKLLPFFEQKVLEILRRRENVSAYRQHLENIVKIPVVFSDKKQALNLLHTVAGCSVISDHKLLPWLLQQDKFSDFLDCESLTKLIDQWLSAATTVMCSTANEGKSIADLCSHIFQVSMLPDALLKKIDMDVKSNIEKKCMKTFCDKALPLIRQMSRVSNLEVLKNILSELRSTGIQSFEGIRSSIEDAVTRIVRKASAYEPEPQYAETLLCLLLQDQLFVEEDCSIEVLNCIATSSSRIIRATFLQAMKPEKFWKISATECEEVCFHWLSHGIDKAKNMRNGKVDYVLHVYNYLTDMFTLPAIACNESVRNRMEMIGQDECLKFDLNALVDMLDCPPFEVQKAAVELLEQHLQNMQISNVMPERDLRIRLDELGDCPSKKWQATHRYGFYPEKMKSAVYAVMLYACIHAKAAERIVTFLLFPHTTDLRKILTG